MELDSEIEAQIALSEGVPWGGESESSSKK